MAVNSHSSLGAGILLNDILLSDPEIKALCAGRVFPIVVDRAVLPYIRYRQIALDTTPAKGRQGADVAVYELRCFGRTHAEAVSLSEEVRRVLENSEGYDGETLHLRGCVLANAWDDESYIDAFCKVLVFNIKASSYN